jgi:hypothetical protein
MMIWYRWKWWIFAWSCNRGGSATAHGYRWSSVFGSRLYIRRRKSAGVTEVIVNGVVRGRYTNAEAMAIHFANVLESNDAMRAELEELRGVRN